MKLPKPLARFEKLIRYGFVGGAAALVDWIIFAIFAKYLEYNYLVVATFGFFLATLVNYLLSIRFVFVSGARFNRTQETTLVYVVSGIGYLVNQLTLWTCHEIFGVELMLSKIIATGTVFFWNFGMRAQLIFKPKAPETPSPQEQSP